jgi:hypothetical protein
VKVLFHPFKGVFARWVTAEIVCRRNVNVEGVSLSGAEGERECEGI